MTWSAYRLLIEIHDDAARTYYEDRAAAEGWSRDRLRTAIASREYEREVKKDPDAAILKRPTEGDYVYRADVVDVTDGSVFVAKDWRKPKKTERRPRTSALQKSANGETPPIA